MRKFTFFLIATFLCGLSSFSQNLFDGWNSGDTPGAAGWTNSTNTAWNATGGNHAYRTSIYTVPTKCIVTDYAPNRIYSYPLTLTGGKFYSFSGQFGAVNGGERNFEINFNTLANKTGTTLHTASYGGNQTVTDTYLNFKFYAPTTGTYYFTYESKTNCRGIIGTLSLTELGNALAVTFDTDGGSVVAPQYLLEGSNEKATKPADPTKAGYIFNGWYDASLTAEYNFSTSVIASMTIYAKWDDIKEELKTLITTATALKVGGTTEGQAYLQAAIDAAQLVVNDNTATTDIVTNSFNALTAAISVYQDASLSSLKVNAVTVAGFSATTYNYNYSIAPNSSALPVTAEGSACAEISIVNGVVTVTAGNGSTKTYTVNFIANYLHGWDGDSSITTPGAAGWLSPDAITWNALNTAAGRNCYRDGLASGGNIRALVGAVSGKYAYPIENLEIGKIYTFSGNHKWVSNGNEGEDRRWTFGANTSIDGAEVSMLGKATGTGNTLATATFSFAYSGESPIYLIWNGGLAAYAIDNLLLVESDDAYVVTFDAKGGSAVASQYLMNNGDATVKSVNSIKDGETLLGWFSDEALTIAWNFDTDKVIGNMTLYAKWDGATSVETADNDNSISIVAVENGVKVTASQPLNVDVVSIVGKIVSSKQVGAGETFIQLAQGLYIINGTKVIVK